MRPKWNLETERRFQERLSSQAIEAYRTATLLAFCLFPAFVLLDYVAHREVFQILAWVRFSTTAFYGVLYFGARKKIYPGGPYTAGMIVFVLASASITSMCLFVGGYSSPYYAGINLVILAAILLFPWDARRMAGVVGAIISTWLLAVSVQARFRIERVDLFINNLYFLISTGLIGVVASSISDQLRRQSFAWGESQKAVEVRDEFVSIASHELKTPLTSLGLQIELAQRMHARGLLLSGVELSKTFDKFKSQVERLRHLIDEMLDLTRVRSGRLEIKPSRSDLGNIVEGVFESISGQFAEHGIEVEFAVESEVCGFWDPFRIEQVITNLLTNAIKYGRGMPVNVRVFRDGEVAVLQVSDQGGGISPESLEKLFHRFERAEAESHISGLGLGLYITREIVEAHRGEIKVESQLGKGSVFEVRLPLQASLEQPASGLRTTRHPDLEKRDKPICR